jgi:UDP-glucose 4-epimerase
LADERAPRPYSVFNVAPADSTTVREIADAAVEAVGLASGSVEFRFSGGTRGWKGDVPIVRLDTTRIRALGWECGSGSLDAVRKALASIVVDARAGRFDG